MLIMKTDMLSTRIDHDTKLEFTQVCEDIGLSPSQAIKLFVQAVINYGGIPFELRKKQPNETTLQTMQELSEGKGQRATGAAALFKDLQVNLNND